jgi:hypothetical protein
LRNRGAGPVDLDEVDETWDSDDDQRCSEGWDAPASSSPKDSSRHRDAGPVDVDEDYEIWKRDYDQRLREGWVASVSEDKASEDKASEDKKRKKEDKKNLKRTIQQQKFLLRMVKTLSSRVEEVEIENRHLNEEKTEMQDLVTQLNQAEEQLEYATEENHEFSTSVRALEQALVVQETELDQALAVIRKHDQEQRKGLETEDMTASLAGDQVDEQLAMSKVLAGVREELDLLQTERDKAVDKATKLSIQMAELRAESDESNALIEHLRNTNHGSSSSVVGGGKLVSAPTKTLSFGQGLFWGKKDEKPLLVKSVTS